MTPTGNDDEFELRLQRGERFVPQFDADLDRPDDAVDRAVLARARAAVLQPPVAEPRYHHAQRTAGRADGATRAADADLPAGVTESAMQPDAEILSAPPAEAAPMASVPATVLSEPVASARALPAAAELRTAPPPIAAAAPRVSAPAPAPTGASAESIAAGAQRREATDEREVAHSADATESPEAWLGRIEALCARGDLAAARRELAGFRRQHPDAELPPALRPLLEP
jgi:hypothetical protein